MPEETSTTYKVRAGSFEGPLDLLLSLIEQRKLFVNEVSLAEVTNDYVAYIKSLSGVETSKRIADVSYFILVAATLILIKSKSLLPGLALTTDEEDKIGDLELRLKLYQIIKNASVDVKSNFGVKIIFSPLDRNWSEPMFSPDSQITVASMAESVLGVLASVPKPVESLPEIEVKKIINIDQVIDSLTERIQSAMNISFREFSKSHGHTSEGEAKVHVIVSFLAMLELVREGIIDVMQNSSFEDIAITKQEVVVE
jgi:segregation and condensation protein A